MTKMSFEAVFNNYRESDWLKVIKDYYSEGGDLHTFGKSDRTLLHQAAYTWRFEVVLWLLEKGIDPNVQNSVGATPLHYSISSEIDGSIQDELDKIEFQCSKLLIEYGADIHFSSHSGETPFDIVKDYGGKVEEEFNDMLGSIDK